MLGGGAAGAVGPGRPSSEPPLGQRAEVSIIIPCRNEASWIRRSLEGLPAQTIAAARWRSSCPTGCRPTAPAEWRRCRVGMAGRSLAVTGCPRRRCVRYTPAREPVSALIAQTRRGARELAEWRRHRVSAWAGRGGVWLAGASPSTRSSVRTPPLMARWARPGLSRMETNVDEVQSGAVVAGWPPGGVEAAPALGFDSEEAGVIERPMETNISAERPSPGTGAFEQVHRSRLRLARAGLGERRRAPGAAVGSGATPRLVGIVLPRRIAPGLPAGRTAKAQDGGDPGRGADRGERRGL